MHRRNTWVGFQLLLAVGVVAALTTSAIAIEDEHTGPASLGDQRVGGEPDAAEGKGGTPKDPKFFPNSPVGKLLQSHLELMFTPAENLEDAEREFQRSVANLRGKNAEQAADLVAKAYAGAPEEMYMERWALMKVLADIGASGSRGTMAKLAKSSLPPERRRDTHLDSTQVDELMIRLRAVDGLATLAAQGNAEAAQDLLDVASNGKANSALRTRAAKGYLKAGGDKEKGVRAKALEGKLSPDLLAAATEEPISREEFQRRVEALKQVSEERTNQDAHELEAEESEAPATTGGKQEPKGKK